MVKRTLKVDALGRVTIPKDIRRMLGIDGKNRVVVEHDMTKLIIHKADVLNDVDESMDEVLRMAGNSHSISNKEFDELNEIFDKLKDELSEV